VSRPPLRPINNDAVTALLRHEFRHSRRPWPATSYWTVRLTETVNMIGFARRHGGFRHSAEARRHIQGLKRLRDTPEFDDRERAAIDILTTGVRGKMWHWKLYWLAHRLAETLPLVGRGYSIAHEDGPTIRTLQKLLQLCGENRTRGAIQSALRRRKDLT
jgi:hypothetical protein